MSTPLLPDALWNLIQPLLPRSPRRPKGGGRDNRQFAGSFGFRSEDSNGAGNPGVYDDRPGYLCLAGGHLFSRFSARCLAAVAGPLSIALPMSPTEVSGRGARL